VIESDKDIVRVVNENNSIQIVRQNQIDKKIVIDSKTMSRDQMGNSISTNDSVKVTSR
jgi:transcription elongation factor